METAITALLLADARARRLVGDRINWLRAPQKQPVGTYAVLTIVSSQPDYHMQGPSGLESRRLQVDTYADTFLGAVDASDALLAVIEGYRGTVGGIRLQAGFVDSRRDLPAADAGDVKKLFRRSADIIIWHSRL